jgi:hypothetical protein
MSMMRKIFKPGVGQRPARFTAAYFNATVAGYRGDLVVWDTTAPASQGSSGVLAGETLGANDFIFVKIADAAALVGNQAGIIEGPTIGYKDGATAITNDTIVIVQTWGVHENVWANATTPVATDMLNVGATTGEVTRAAAGTVAATAIADGAIVAIALKAATTDHVRGTVATEENVVAFVRCDF